VVLSLVYYTCPMLCNQILNGMLSSFRQISFNPGEQFEVINVSFDPKDTPAIAAAKKILTSKLTIAPVAKQPGIF